ncbi:MAG TPA: hypothetical protein ENK56_10045 [Chloroflexi bacterium]|nr:hypothetical protein [Chloroflexota bacterium]
MSQQALQKLVGTAVVDRRFRKGFLNGGRRRLLTRFDLATEEREAVLSIRAATLEGFAAELEQRLSETGASAAQPLVWRTPVCTAGSCAWLT